MSAYGHPPRVTARRPGEAGARAGLCAQDSGSSGALAAAARQLGMSEQDIFDLALARSAWRSMVAVRLGGWQRSPLMVQDAAAGAAECHGIGARVRLRRS